MQPAPSVQTSSEPAIDLRNTKAGTRGLQLLLHLGFVLTGVVNTMLGPMLPALSARWTLSDAQAGYLFSTQFAGSMLGVMGSSVLTTRRGHRPCLVLGLALMALGSIALVAGDWTLGLVATLSFGVGLGLAIPTTNLLISELNPEKRTAALSLINFSWGAGAAVCPFLVAAMLRMHRHSHLLDAIAGLLILVAISLTRVSFPNVCAPRHAATMRMQLLRNRWIPILGALFFLYVGTEAGVGGWIATYAQRLSPASGTIWIFMPSFFWAALLVGRAITPLLLRSMQEAALARLGLAGSTIGLALLLSATTLSLIALAVSLAGFGFSSIFPIAIASLSRKFGANASHIAGSMFALAGAGGAILPWLVGYISTATGNLKFGLLVPLLGSILMLILNMILAQKE